MDRCRVLIGTALAAGLFTTGMVMPPAKSFTCAEVQWGRTHLSQSTIEAYKAAASPADKAKAASCLGARSGSAEAADNPEGARKQHVTVPVKTHSRQSHAQTRQGQHEARPRRVHHTPVTPTPATPATTAVATPPTPVATVTSAPVPPWYRVSQHQGQHEGRRSMLDLFILMFAAVGVFAAGRKLLDYVHQHKLGLLSSFDSVKHTVAVDVGKGVSAVEGVFTNTSSAVNPTAHDPAFAAWVAGDATPTTNPNPPGAVSSAVSSAVPNMESRVEKLEAALLAHAPAPTA